MTDAMRTPESTAADLLSGHLPVPNSAEDAAAVTRRVCVMPNSGRFRLQWSAATIGEYDWVGLYASAASTDDDYISGAWQWASTASKIFDTSVPVGANYQARYLIWNATIGRYKSVAKTPEYPNVRVNSTPVGYPRQPTTTEWQQLVSSFPNLQQSSCWVTAPATPVYNCIAWSLGLDDRWLNPDSPLSEFQNQYQSWGNKTVTKLSSSATIDGWGTSASTCTHGSKSYTGRSVGTAGLWESKCGRYLRITHERQGLDSTGYGSIIASFFPGYAVAFEEVLELRNVPELQEHELATLTAHVAVVPADLSASFEHTFQEWKNTWFTGDTAMSNNTHDLARGEAYETLKSMGAAILPLLVNKLRVEENFPALILYDNIQPVTDLVIGYAASDPRAFEGEQARAGRTVTQWIAAQLG